MGRTSAVPRICFFIGPSIRAHQVREELAGVEAEVEILPPVQQGDLLRLHPRLPDVIGIIDGYFYQVPAVYHKEILVVLEQGTRVLGSSSLGALRAAELDVFGMEGVGQVYRLYKRGSIDGDDEVALVHLEEDEHFRPMTVPLVTIRHNVARARGQRIISARTAAAVVASGKRLRFTHRTYRAALAGVPASAAPAEELARLADFLAHHAVDIKHADARALVRTVAERLRGQQPWPERPALSVYQTSYLRRQQQHYCGRWIDGTHVPEDTALMIQKLLSPSFPRLLRRVALRCLALDEARALGLTVEGAECLLARFRRRQGLGAAEAFAAWLEPRALTAGELGVALQERALEERLVARYRSLQPELPCRAQVYRRILQEVSARTGIEEASLLGAPLMHPGLAWHGPLLREMKVRGRYGAAMATAAAILAHNERLAVRFPNFMEHLAPSGLDRWFAARWGVAEAELRAALPRWGFADYAEFLQAARIAYVYDGLAMRKQIAVAS